MTFNMATQNPTFLSNLAWLGKELLKIFHSPIGVAGGMLDAARGWKFSRSWMSIWLNLPVAFLLAAVYGVFVFSQFSRSDGQVQRFLVESETRCATNTLESACSSMQEPDFSKALGTSAPAPDANSVVVTDLSKKYVELLSKRILAIEGGNQSARYRLGLINYLGGEKELAEKDLNDLALGKYGLFPPANAWLSKELLPKMNGENANSLLPQLMENLDKASNWKGVDYRLLLVYARLLETSGDIQKAIVITRKAVAINPEANLELARLYAKVKDEDGLRVCAYAVEDYFVPRLNTPREKDTDRMAVAEVRKLTKRYEQAAEVLSEGLLNKTGRLTLRRELSEIQRLMYLDSIAISPEKIYTADLSLLEKVVDTDPDNPNISVEVAKLLPMDIKSTSKLVASLRAQMKKDITSGAAYMLMAEGYYRKGETKAAIINWEFALKKDPRNFLAMNNLALQLAKENPTKLERSVELLNQAVALVPNNAEILDSFGEVMMIANKPKEAINKFELAIRLDKTRMSTRLKLVEAYEAANLKDMAKSQRNAIDEINKAILSEQSKIQEETKAPPTKK
jgi:tetratricopeptide (TPR) repeat protein